MSAIVEAHAITTNMTYPGVYKIQSLVDSKVYIGSTVNLARRIVSHERLLNRGKHFNDHLQKAWNKYGRKNFKFIILEKCPIAIIRVREIHWIQEYNACDQKFGYNLYSVVDSEWGLSNTHKQAIAKAATIAGTSPELRKFRSEQAKAMHKAGLIGRRMWPEESETSFRQKLKKAWKRRKPKERKERACAVCGIWGMIKVDDLWYCLPHDPIPGRQEARNESRRKAQKAITNRALSPETRRKISKALTGRVKSAEECSNISKAAYRRYAK